MQAIQFVSQKRSFFTLRNILEVILYILSILVTVQFSSYTLNDIRRLSGGRLFEDEIDPLIDFQHETGLRLVRSLMEL